MGRKLQFILSVQSKDLPQWSIESAGLVRLNGYDCNNSEMLVRILTLSQKKAGIHLNVHSKQKHTEI